MFFFLASLREIADTLHIADDTSHVVNVRAMAHGTLFEVAFINMSTFVADGIRDVEGEVVASLLSRHTQQLAVLFFAEVLFQVEVQRRTAGEVRDVLTTMETELVENVNLFIFNNIEITIITIAGHHVTVFAVPLGVLHTHILSGNHLAVEHEVFALIAFVVIFNHAQDLLHEMLVFFIIGDGNLEEFGSLHQSVDTDGEVLAIDGN